LGYFLGRQPDFMGNGNPAATAAPFRRLARGETVLFPGAKNSRQSVQMAINSEVETISIAIYDNQPVENPALRTESVLAFTSPMNAQAYFAVHPMHRRQFGVAIGNSTAEAMLKLGVLEVAVAAEATEKGLAEAVMSIRAW
ncbi:MAG: uroporphyrinogen-III synthase, partial [Saprospiraceae bacterium]|nr:uroporphyrinogen-III synthase [Saprospiraceae bacterium]